MTFDQRFTHEDLARFTRRDGAEIDSSTRR
jgi:hypothetical protein